MKPRRCPQCRKIVPFDKGFFFHKNNSLACKCGHKIFDTQEKTTYAIKVTYTAAYHYNNNNFNNYVHKDNPEEIAKGYHKKEELSRNANNVTLVYHFTTKNEAEKIYTEFQNYKTYYSTIEKLY